MVRVLAGFIYILPRRVALFLARLLARMSYRIVRRQRDKTFENLERVYGREKSNSAIHTMGCRVFENLAQTAVELLQFPKLAGGKVEQIVETGEASRVYQSLLNTHTAC